VLQARIVVSLRREHMHDNSTSLDRCFRRVAESGRVDQRVHPLWEQLLDPASSERPLRV
jgi:hypothetical protein